LEIDSGRSRVEMEFTFFHRTDEDWTAAMNDTFRYASSSYDSVSGVQQWQVENLPEE
jgi:hypothetical protein